MPSPLVLTDLNDFTVGLFHRSYAVSPGMSPVLVVIALIIAELVLQVSRSPKEGVIQ